MSFAVDRDRAGNRRRRITRQAHACHRGKKIGTVIRHARAGGLANTLAASTLVVAMIAPPLVGLPVPGAGGSFGLGARRDLARRPAEHVAAVAGAADAEHELTLPTALEAQLLVVVHRRLPR